MPGILSSISSAVSGILKPATDLIDELHTSQEEKDAAKARLEEIIHAHRQKVLDNARALAEAQRDVIVTEAASSHWLAANWRPLLMLCFGFVILYSVIGPALGAPPVDMSGIPERFWGLMTVGIGGYIGFRTVEKVAPRIWGKDEEG